MSTDSRAALPTPVMEQPLNRGAKAVLMISAALAILLFYLFAIITMVFLLGLLAGELVAALAAARFGFLRLITPFIERHTALLLLLLRSLWLTKGMEFRVPIHEADAPPLFQFLRDLSARMGVRAPREVVIQMNAGAWVRLGGFRRGANATTLGLGYDLLAGLTEREVEAVLAHEMAHAKLVRRGLKRWLVSGLNRAGKLTHELAAQVDAYRRAHQTFELGEWLLGGANFCLRLAARLVAGYSRQDEFEADRGAADVCGAAPLRSSLTKLERLVTKTARIGWNERVALLQRGNGFSSWLVEQLAVDPAGPTAAEAAEATDPFSTHPALRDRLAALPPDDGASAPSAPAIEMFAHPDDIGTRLVAEIHRVAALAEKRDTRERARWLRRTRRGSNFRGTQLPGILVFVLGVLVMIFSLALADASLGGLIVGAIIIAAGVWFTVLGRYRARREVPVPDFARLQAASREDDLAAREAREKELETRLRADGAAEPKHRRRLERYVTEAYQALGECDYLRTHVAARLAIELDRKCVEAQLAMAIAWGAFHQRQHVTNLLRAVHANTNFFSAPVLWGAGWALMLLGDWAAAEAMIEAARKSRPDDPNLAAVLAWCQSQRGKIQSGIANARLARAAAPGDPARLKLLLNLLIAGGYYREAQALVAGADLQLRSDAELTLAMVRLNLLVRDLAETERWTAELRQHGIGPDAAVELGATNESARRDDDARGFYEQALQHGHYPEALLGLARLALHRGEKETAARLAMEALDFEKPVGPKGRGAGAVFTEVLGLQIQIAETIPKAEAWVVAVTGNAVAGPIASHSFLIFAADMHDAQRRFKLIADAMQPGKASLVPNYVVLELAPKHQQPIGHARAGIQRFWRH